ncbi:MAG: hypothetical protein ACOYN3_02745 [Acidimicrobiia bacterium]
MGRGWLQRWRSSAIAVVVVCIVVLLSNPRLATADPSGAVAWSRPTATATVSVGAASSVSAKSWTQSVVDFYFIEFRSTVLAVVGGSIVVSFLCNPEVRDGSDFQMFASSGPVPPDPYTGTLILYSSSPISKAFDAFTNRSVGIYCKGSSSSSITITSPPSAEEIWREASISGNAPTVELQPSGHGLTGLNTPLWLSRSGSEALPISRTIGSWTVTATVYLRGYEWRVSDAATDTVVASEGSIGPTGDSNGAGSAGSPLATFRFRTKGTYRVTGTAVWGASGTITGPFGYSQSLTFPSAGLSSTYDYPVDELVGVLGR